MRGTEKCIQKVAKQEGKSGQSEAALMGGLKVSGHELGKERHMFELGERKTQENEKENEEKSKNKEQVKKGSWTGLREWVRQRRPRKNWRKAGRDAGRATGKGRGS